MKDYQHLINSLDFTASLSYIFLHLNKVQIELDTSIQSVALAVIACYLYIHVFSVGL